MSDEQQDAMDAADGRGILGEDYLGGVDPVDAVRAQRDDEPADSEEIRTPVTFEIGPGDMAKVTFGPMPLDDLSSMLGYIGTEEGNREFFEQFCDVVEAKLAEQQAAAAAEGDDQGELAP